MPPDSGTQVDHARTASCDDLESLVYDAGEEILPALLENLNLEEQHVTALLERLDLPASVLGAVAAAGKWASNEAFASARRSTHAGPNDSPSRSRDSSFLPISWATVWCRQPQSIFAAWPKSSS